MPIKKKILIVDDDQVISSLLKDKFTLAGFDVELAMDGESGLAKIRRTLYDLVILDIMMPKMHGLDVLVHIKKDADIMNMPVIMLTTLDSTERARQAKKLGAIEYFVKSKIKIDDVVNKIKEILK